MESQESKNAIKGALISKILVPTDFSPISDRALDLAAALARRHGASIYLAHVITPDPFQFAEPQLAQATYEKVRQAAEEGITDILNSGKLRGISHEVLMEEGGIWPTLESWIEKHQIDLVVVGMYGHLGKAQKLLIGSAVEEIFRKADCAVLTVGAGVSEGLKEGTEFNHILFATDFGPGAEKGAEYACTLAQDYKAALTLLHVIESAATHSGEDVTLQRETSVARMKKLMPKSSEHWCKPEFSVTFGTAVEGILSTARETKADLIVMGAKAGSGLVGHAPATIAYNITSQAPCPVLIIRG